MRIGEYETHPAADAFPLMNGDEFALLVADVKVNGQRDAAVLYQPPGVKQKLILDGRNRLLACVQAKKKPRYRTYEGDDPVGYVVSLNIHRRHLNESQRAIVAARLAELGHGGNRRRSSGTTAARTQADAAKLLNVGERTVREAKSVLERAVPELLAAVERGDITVGSAAELAKRPAGDQRALLEQASNNAAALNRLLKQPAAADVRSPRQQLLAAFVRAAEQLGASSHAFDDGIVLTYRGHNFALELRAA